MGKQVGILSMQKVINYGSFLQAFALRQLLLRNGADKVDFIDIIRGRSLKGFESSGFKYALRRMFSMFKVILQGRANAKRKTMAYRAALKDTIMGQWSYLGIKEGPNQSDHYDLAVIGSDEVFHCCQASEWGYTTQLYGNIPQAKEVVSYAGSFGATKMEDLKRQGIDNEIGENLKRLKSISVRDDNSFEIVRQLTGKIPNKHIDPVLAYGFEKEIDSSPAVDESNYILVYSYPDRINKSKEVKAICEFAKSHGKKLICVMSRYDWCDRAIIPSPLELLAWFKNADMVVTETFHGTIFSIISRRQFVTIGRESSMPKLTSMLSTYGLEYRLLKKTDDISRLFSTVIDYDKVFKKLNELRIDTNEYLKFCLRDA